MYKVFFKDRKVFLTDNFAEHFQVKYGLFCKLREGEDLQELIRFYSNLKSIDSLYIFHPDIDYLRQEFRKCFIPIDAAGGLVTNSKGEFLLIHRKGKWDLPKGKLDDGESFETAAVREVEEECGINGVQLLEPLVSTYHTYPYKEGTALKKTSWYTMHYNGNGTPVPQEAEDISEVRWVSRNKLHNYLEETFPAIRDVFICHGIV